MVQKRVKATGKSTGRPPAGPGGLKVSGYPQLTVRIPPDTKHRLEALSALRGVPLWQLIDAAVIAFVDQLPDGERKLLAQFSAHRRQA
jgi:hypothetical protein